MPPVDTRWDRAARVASAGADDDGFEYCYTLRDSSGRIAAAADLPDPNWNFDAFGDGVTRGTQVYLDSEPRPWVVRFKRPIPRGTNAGADVGSVPWVQEPAYRLRK